MTRLLLLSIRDVSLVNEYLEAIRGQWLRLACSKIDLDRYRLCGLCAILSVAFSLDYRLYGLNTCIYVGNKVQECGWIPEGSKFGDRVRVSFIEAMSQVGWWFEMSKLFIVPL
jgi:hypothetical protein